MFDVLRPEKERKLLLEDGVIFFSRPYRFRSENKISLNNIYGVEIDQQKNKLEFDMLTNLLPSYPISLVSQAIKNGVSVTAGLNTNFFFLVDETNYYPKDYSYNLNICDGILYQLPNADKTALLIDKNGNLKSRFVRAKGSLEIGDIKIDWIGSKSKNLSNLKKDVGIIYNTANMGIVRIPDALTGSKRILDLSRSKTPFSTGRINLVMNLVGKSLEVTLITHGNTHFFEGNFIISVPSFIGRRIKVGDKLSYCRIDNLVVGNLRAAVTVGVNLPKAKKSLATQIKKQTSIITYNDKGSPFFDERARFSRSVVFKTKKKIVFMVIDSRPRVDNQQGVNIYELQKCVYLLYPDIIWAANCDGGHASKLVIVKNKKIDVFGNLHYEIWPKDPSGVFVWNGKKGRKVTSLIIVKKL